MPSAGVIGTAIKDETGVCFHDGGDKRLGEEAAVGDVEDLFTITGSRQLCLAAVHSQGTAAQDSRKGSWDSQCDDPVTLLRAGYQVSRPAFRFMPLANSSLPLGFIGRPMS